MKRMVEIQRKITNWNDCENKINQSEDGELKTPIKEAIALPITLNLGKNSRKHFVENE